MKQGRCCWLKSIFFCQFLFSVKNFRGPVIDWPTIFELLLPEGFLLGLSRAAAFRVWVLRIALYAFAPFL
jgi:hypothetical protein